MARVSKEALEARAREAENQMHILQLGMHCALSGEIEWIAKEKTNDGEKYRFGVARLNSPHGGLFFVRFDYAGQNPSFTVSYLDEVLSACRDMPNTEFARIRVHALDIAVNMRYKAINQ